MLRKKNHKSDSDNDISTHLEEAGFAELPPPRSGVVLPFFMALLFATALVTQYLWFFKPAVILQNPQLRPLLELICDVAECTLPATRNIYQLEVLQRYVDRHQHTHNAVLAHILFQNKAAYHQPYPWLELRFYDEHKELVAVRRFAPEDYLDNPARARSALPPLQPVHVKLEFFEAIKDMHTYGFEIAFW
jgi:hypothetical protein